MTIAKTHPCNTFGWLHVEPRDAAAAMNEQLRLRDAEKELDRHFSGEPPAFREWSINQVRSLARQPHVARQIEKRRESLLIQLAKNAADRESRLASLDRQAASIAADLALLDQLEGAA